MSVITCQVSHVTSNGDSPQRNAALKAGKLNISREEWDHCFHFLFVEVLIFFFNMFEILKSPAWNQKMSSVFL